MFSVPAIVKRVDARVAERIIEALIIYSIVTMALETMPELSAYQRFFQVSETVVVAIFTVEYLVRWLASKNRARYPFTFLAIVDLLAILPFYIAIGIDIRGLRAIRLLRTFRILKLGRYSEAMRMLGEAFRRTAPEMAAFSFVAAVVIVISAMLLYYAEHDAQPETYTSIPSSLWWAIVTLTTVGYGDVYPATTIGRLVASVVMLMGIGFIAIPTGLLSSSMTEIMYERRQQRQEPQDAGSRSREPNGSNECE